MKNIRTREFFRDFDKLNKGTVTEPQFRRIMNMSNISFTEEEMTVLNKAFIVTGEKYYFIKKFV